MIKFTVTRRIVFVALTLWLISTLAILGGCKKKDQPEDNQQANGPQKTEHGSVSEKVDKADTSEKFGLRILYVGLPNTERQKDFVSFLSKNFTEVKTADLYTFKEEQTKDSDVVILDKDGIQWGSRGGKPLRDLKVSDQYSRSTISLGIPGAFWTDRMKLKTGYM